MLNDLLCHADAKRILASPSNTSQDNYFWAHKRDGVYSVNSGNWLLSREATHAVNISPELKECNVLKLQIWALNTVPKIKFFFWRPLSGALAVFMLASHGLQPDMICGVFFSRGNNISFLFHCIPAKKVWDLFNIPLPLQGFFDSFQRNVELLFGIMETLTVPLSLQLLIPWIVWGL